MKINGKGYRSLWLEENIVKFIDQRKLPYKFDIFSAKTVDDIKFAIKEMVVRGAPAIGAAAAYGIALSGENIKKSAEKLRATRPTAYDLFYAINYIINKILCNNLYKMTQNQINLILPKTLFKKAEEYAYTYGFRNIQDLAIDALRDKVFFKRDYDDSFSDKEISLIDKVIETGLSKGLVGTEADLREALKSK